MKIKLIKWENWSDIQLMVESYGKTKECTNIEECMALYNTYRIKYKYNFSDRARINVFFKYLKSKK